MAVFALPLDGIGDISDGNAGMDSTNESFLLVGIACFGVGRIKLSLLMCKNPSFFIEFEWEFTKSTAGKEGCVGSE